MKQELNEPLISKEEGQGGNSEAEKMRNIFNNEYNNENYSSEKYFLENFQSVENLAKYFKTDLERGLSTLDKDDLKWREDKWGNNNLPPEEENSILEHILECLEDPMLRILLLASIVSLIIGLLKDGIATGWIEGSAIFFAVFLVTTISSYLNYQKKEQFLQLSRENRFKKVVLKRDGEDKEVSIEAILVGDLLKLRIGDIVNVDGFIFGNCKVGMDESPVTGESDTMWKANEFDHKNGKYVCPFILSGSQVQDGYGYMLVAAVGEYTFEGSNKELDKAKNAKDEEGEDANLTPLQKQLNDLANLIGDLGYIMAGLIGLALIIKESIVLIYQGIPLFSSAELDIVVNAFIIAVTVIVVAIPEGLPMAVAISFAYSVQKMKNEHNLVKHLDKSEAMGNVNNVCTDKTGTLTLGTMSVITLYFERKDIKIASWSTVDEKGQNLVYDSIKNNINVVETLNEKGQKELTGDMTEKALYRFLINQGVSPKDKEEPQFYLPFKSEYKYMMSVYKTEDGNFILYAKGASETISPFMTKFLCENGKLEGFEENKKGLFDKQTEYSNNSIRTLIFGYKKIPKNEMEKLKSEHEELNLEFFKELAQNLIFAFMVGIRDELRPEVPDSISRCHNAGITVRMVTGDNFNTAVAIAKDCRIINESETGKAKRIAAQYKEFMKLGESKNPQLKAKELLQENPIALEGEVFRVVCGGLSKKKLDNGETDIFLNNRETFKFIAKDLRVIARASPEDKFLLVLGLKELGNIVAVTGDGTNDAPALRQSHVGFAMGIRGTDIAKDAADVVLLNDSFSSIITACKYGRNIYDCIRKFIQFQLTVNIVAVFMTFLGGIILNDSPLNAIQMLWVNLIMDSFASLALATEDPSEKLLDRKPYPRNSSILTPMMILNIISQAVFQIVTLTVLLFYGDVMFGVPSDRQLDHFTWNNTNGYHFTIFFNIFVFMQVFNSINARKLQKTEFNVFDGIFNNSLYIIVQLVILFGQIIIVTIGGRAVRTHPLSIIQHLYCLLIASLTLVFGFLVKLLPLNLKEVKYAEEEDEESKPSRKKVVGIGYSSRGGMKMKVGGSGALQSHKSKN